MGHLIELTAYIKLTGIVNERNTKGKKGKARDTFLLNLQRVARTQRELVLQLVLIASPLWSAAVQIVFLLL